MRRKENRKFLLLCLLILTQNRSLVTSLLMISLNSLLISPPIYTDHCNFDAGCLVSKAHSLPALDLRLVHESSQMEAGSPRKVSAAVKAVAFGALAERLARQAPGSSWRFQGFLATPRNSKTVVLHIQDIQQN